jgi:hypothetical protein
MTAALIPPIKSVGYYHSSASPTFAAKPVQFDLFIHTVALARFRTGTERRKPFKRFPVLPGAIQRRAKARRE